MNWVINEIWDADTNEEETQAGEKSDGEETLFAVQKPSILNLMSKLDLLSSLIQKAPDTKGNQESRITQIQRNEELSLEEINWLIKEQELSEKSTKVENQPANESEKQMKTEDQLLDETLTEKKIGNIMKDQSADETMKRKKTEDQSADETMKDEGKED